MESTPPIEVATPIRTAASGVGMLWGQIIRMLQSTPSCFGLVPATTAIVHFFWVNYKGLQRCNITQALQSDDRICVAVGLVQIGVVLLGVWKSMQAGSGALHQV